MIDITSECNLNCEYCLRDVKDKGRHISDKVLYDVCQYVTNYCNDVRLKNVSIQFWGGEPLLRINSILNAVSWINPTLTKVHYSIETNGTLLTKPMIELLFKNKIGIGISVDGNSKIHDKQRKFRNGKPSLNIIERHIREALNVYGERIGTITTITKNNMNVVDDVIGYLGRDLGIRNLKFNFVHDSIFNNCEGITLTEDDAAYTQTIILNSIVNLNKSGIRVSEYNIKVKLQNLLFLQYSDICLSRGCHGGYKMIVFDMDGNYFPCELTDILKYRIGSIYDGRDFIESIDKAIENNEYFSTVDTSMCQECEWYVYCKGGCTIKSLCKKDGENKVDIIECAVNKTLYPVATRTQLENIVRQFCA